MFDSDSDSSQNLNDSRIDSDSGIGIVHHWTERSTNKNPISFCSFLTNGGSTAYMTFPSDLLISIKASLKLENCAIPLGEVLSSQGILSCRQGKASGSWFHQKRVIF